MNMSLKNTAFKLGEYVGLLASIVFMFELTTTDRHLQFFDATGSKLGLSNFLMKNDRKIVLLNFNAHQDSIEELYPEDGEIEVHLGNDKTIYVDWKNIAVQPLTKAFENRAEDESFGFEGPVFVTIEEAEGDEYIRLKPAPYTDSIAERARCSKALLNSNGLRYVYLYMKRCMLGS